MQTDDKPEEAEDGKTTEQLETTAQDQGQGAEGATGADGGEGKNTKPEPSKADKALEAFSKGVEEATPPKPGATGPDASKPDDAGATGPTGPSAGATGGTGPTGTDDPEKLAEAERETAIVKELNDLGLRSEKARKRFRSLLERPTWEAVEEKFAPAVELAKQAQQYHAILDETRASPQQVGEMFKVIGDVNSGEPDRMRTAVQSMYKQLVWAAGQIGEPLEAFDPLANFPDLQQQVEAEEITRAAANEIMKARMSGRITETQRTRQQTQQQQQQEWDNANKAMVADMKVFDEAVRSDPQYEAKRQAMGPIFDTLKENGIHPSKWVNTIRRAWKNVKVAPPRRVTPTPSPAPLRPGNGAGSPRVQGISKDPARAFDQGLEALANGGQAFD